MKIPLDRAPRYGPTLTPASIYLPAPVSALIENLQAAMRNERLAYVAQNRFLGKLAPMKRDAVER